MQGDTNPFAQVQNAARNRCMIRPPMSATTARMIKVMFEDMPADEAFKLAQQIMAEAVRRSQEITHRRSL